MRIFLPKGFPEVYKYCQPHFVTGGKIRHFKNIVHFDVSVLGILLSYVGEAIFRGDLFFHETNISIEQISFHTPW